MLFFLSGSKKEVYEQELVLAKTKKFFKYLKNTGPYYDAKVWEKDYRRQVSSMF